MIRFLQRLCGVLLIVVGGVPLCIAMAAAFVAVVGCVAAVVPVLAFGLLVGCVAGLGLMMVID